MLATTPSFADAIYTNELPYDHVPLNSKTWQEVDMSYWTTIHGKPYLNTINLLRPKAYLAQHHIDQVGRKITLTLPEIGLNNNIVTITAIKTVPAFKKCHKKTCSQVIGLFKHYATHVQTYRFINLTTGNISTIHATPNHPFYVKNKHQFLPISEVTVNDQLVGESNHIIKLICATNQLDHCGRDYNKQKPSIVYNLEVYQQHNYLVGNKKILVHNGGCLSTQHFSEEFEMRNLKHDHKRVRFKEQADEHEIDRRYLGRANPTYFISRKMNDSTNFYLETMHNSFKKEAIEALSNPLENKKYFTEIELVRLKNVQRVYLIYVENYEQQLTHTIETMLIKYPDIFDEANNETIDDLLPENIKKARNLMKYASAELKKYVIKSSRYLKRIPEL